MNRSRLRRYTPLRSRSFARGGLMRRTRLRCVSKRRSARLDRYYRLRKEFMARPENQICPVAMALWGMKLRPTDIHHRKGRYGSMLCDTRYWLAVSREGHEYIHHHGSESRSRGWLG